MNRLFLRFYNWLFGIKKITMTSEEQRSYKSAIRFFFEGITNMVEPAVDIPVSKLGINSFEFDLSFNELTITITLERPGLMIGKGGKTIFELEKFLSTREYCVPVKLQLKDSKLWY